MKRIALTGGMGTGKSHVKAVFAALGVPTMTPTRSRATSSRTERRDSTRSWPRSAAAF